MDDTQVYQLPTIPQALLAELAGIARTRFGKAAPEGERLVAAVQRTSLRYTRQRSDLAEAQSDPASLTARLRYFLPRDLYKVWGPLTELSACDALPRRPRLRLLDVGAGLGASTLGVGAFLGQVRACERLAVLALDADPVALAIYGEVLAHARGLPLPRVQAHTRCRRLRPDDPIPEGPFELIVVGLLLNEMLQSLPESERAERGARFLHDLAERLTSDGCLVVLEPALREPSRDLHRMRDRLSSAPGAPYVFAPCLGIDRCPMLLRARDWCHERLPGVLPEPLAALSRAAGLREEGLTFSYLTLRRTSGTWAAGAPSRLRPYRVVGGPVRSKGKVECLLCGVHDAPRLLHLTRHLSHHAPEALPEVGRGALLGLEPDAGAAPGTTPVPRVRVRPDVPVRVLRRWAKPDAGDDPR